MQKFGKLIKLKTKFFPLPKEPAPSSGWRPSRSEVESGRFGMLSLSCLVWKPSTFAKILGLPLKN